MANPKAIFKAYYSDLLKGTREENTITAISRVSNGLRQTTLRALAKFPHTEELANEVRGIKEKSIE